MRKTFILEDLDCAHCAQKIEDHVAGLDGVSNCKVTFLTQKLVYDVEDDINTIAQFKPLITEDGLFKNYQLDESRTCIFWTEEIDLPSDTIWEYGERV